MNWLEQKTLGLFVKTNGKLSQPWFGGLGHVFMLHRVLPDAARNRYTLNRDLAITPEYLETCIRYFSEHGYRFISLDELYLLLTQNTPPAQKFVCFTLDDGYRDNYTYGLPVFAKYHVPFTVYVTNCFPNRTAILWWYWLEKTLREKTRLLLETVEGRKEYRWQSEAEGLACFHEMRKEIRRLPKNRFRNSLLSAFDITEDDAQAQCNELAMDWTELAQFSQEPGVTIGAHTLHHLSLTALSPAEVHEEMAASKQELEQRLQKPVDHFAYPYGGFEDAHLREYRCAREVGFKTSVLNFPGNVFPAHAQALQAIPRMPLGNSTPVHKLDAVRNGITHFSYNGFRKTLHYGQA